MIVALHITSESGDNYLLLFQNKTVQEIKEEIYNNECYYGASVTFETLDDTDAEYEELQKMLYDFEEDSWNFGD